MISVLASKNRLNESMQRRNMPNWTKTHNVEALSVETPAATFQENDLACLKVVNECFQMICLSCGLDKYVGVTGSTCSH